MNQEKVRFITVSDKEDGMPLLSFLSRVCERVPKTLFYRWIRKGNVRVNKKKAAVRKKLASGDLVRIPPVVRDTAPNTTSPFNPEILFEDENIIAINKPTDIPVHGGTGISESIIDSFRSFGSVFQPIPAHRLDMDTSGVLILAKTHKAARELKENWSSFSKFYIAGVDISQKEPEKKRSVLVEHRIDDEGNTVSNDNLSGKLCRLKYRWVRNSNNLICIKLITGRKRQIRAQLSACGFPVSGDRKFGKQAKRMLLHCHKMIIFLSGKTYCFRSPLPVEFFPLHK